MKIGHVCSEHAGSSSISQPQLSSVNNRLQQNELLLNQPSEGMETQNEGKRSYLEVVLLAYSLSVACSISGHTGEEDTKWRLSENATSGSDSTPEHTMHETRTWPRPSCQYLHILSKQHTGAPSTQATCMQHTHKFTLSSLKVVVCKLAIVNTTAILPCN